MSSQAIQRFTISRPLYFTFLLVFFIGFVPSNARSPLSVEPTIASVRHYFSPQHNLAHIDYSILGSAKFRIDIAAYVLSDRGIMESLIQAAKRGVHVRLYLDPDQRAMRRLDRSPLFASLLAERRVKVRVKRGGRNLMHLKAYQVDGKIIRTGAANFSYSGMRKQDNDLLLIESGQLAEQFVRRFEKLWTRSGSEPLTLDR